MFNYKPSNTLLNDRIILVTGAGDGIGKAAAKKFAAHGATVILLGRTTAKLESVYDEIEQAGYPQPAIYPMNLEGATPNDYENLAEVLMKNFGKLDGLLHNAGILGSLTPLEHYNVEQWYKIMQVNLNAPFLLTKACLRLMKLAANASIIFTSANVGRKGKAYWGAYSAAYFGIEGLMQVLTDELETNTNIRVNSIDPGAVNTRMRTDAYPGEDPKNLPNPNDVTPLYLYLMGTDSSKINGQALTTNFRF
ncbi:YciK family oxidoreductase [Candidatus Halobeggiatoa sp. HSG11]|nr:YciK family oxidoreductase [Candidatus Halobeggiatoa sp. HSG11]